MYSRVQALPTDTHAYAWPSHTHMSLWAHVLLWHYETCFFLIFWGIFRRLSSAVSLLAEPFHLLLSYFSLAHFSLSSLHACLKHCCSLLRSSLWAARGRDASPSASWQHCLFSASASVRELALCVWMWWGAGPDERELPRKPQDQNAYGNEARYDKYIFLV